MFHRNKHRAPKGTELPALDPSTFVNNKAQVLQTIEQLEIPRDRLIVVGSAVVTLLGLPRHAHDVDLILHPDDLHDAYRRGALPNGIHVVSAPGSRLEQLHLQSATDPLPSEFLSHESPLDKSSFHDFAQYRTATSPDGLLIQQAGALRSRKSNSIRINTGSGDHLTKIAQDRYDAWLLEQYQNNK